MNGKDFDDMCKMHREYMAKEQARLDYIYEQESRKYHGQNNTSYSGSTTSNFRNNGTQVPQQNNNERLDRLEARVDKLYDMFSNMNQKYFSNGLFVIASSGSNVVATHSIILTDSQFQELMSKLVASD